MKHLSFIQTMHSKLEESDLNAHDWEIRSLQAIGSTNTRVLDMLGLYNKVIVLSQTQSKGRGRESKMWYSPMGGLWISFGFLTDAEVIELSTPVIEEVHKILSGYVSCDIKEPNDILIDEKKVCGILVVSKIQSNRLKQVIVGIGINVDNEIPDEVADLATRLADYMDDTPDIHQLASTIVVNIIKRLESNIPNL